MLMVKKLLYLLPLILMFLLFFLYRKNTFWDGKEKFSYLTRKDNGDVLVTSIDPLLGEKTDILIPGDTEVSVSRGYGLLRLKNVWQLGINEKIGGKLLCETITKNFLFPVRFWWNGKETNISFVDRFKIGLFEKKLGSGDLNEIDMAKSQFVKKTKLTDGDSGYQITGQSLSRLTIYFSDNKLLDKNVTIGVTDLTGSTLVSETFGSILEVIGGKVVSLERKGLDKNIDCEVSGKNPDAVSNAVTFFGCTKKNSQSNFDLEVVIGGKFASRF